MNQTEVNRFNELYERYLRLRDTTIPDDAQKHGRLLAF